MAAKLVVEGLVERLEQLELWPSSAMRKWWKGFLGSNSSSRCMPSWSQDSATWRSRCLKWPPEHRIVLWLMREILVGRCWIGRSVLISCCPGRCPCVSPTCRIFEPDPHSGQRCEKWERGWSSSGRSKSRPMWSGPSLEASMDPYRCWEWIVRPVCKAWPWWPGGSGRCANMGVGGVFSHQSSPKNSSYMVGASSTFLSRSMFRRWTLS